MIFSTRHLENNVLFDFNNISLSPVHMHKHLGVIFSNDCKWTKHIDVESKLAYIDNPVTIRAASICIFSRRLQFACPQLSQTSEAYSKIGRMKTKYIIPPQSKILSW
jgi:hypothetical protein